MDSAQRYDKFYQERMERLGRLPNPSQVYNSYSFRKHVFDFIKKLDLLPGSKILDAGCGNGSDLIVLNEIIPKLKLYGIDPSSYAIKTAKKYTKKRGLNNIFLMPGNFEEYDFKQKFDVIICLEVIEHLPDMRSVRMFLFALNNALEEGGHLILSTPNKENIYRTVVRQLLPKGVSKRLLTYMNKNAEVYSGLVKGGHEYHPSAMTFKETRLFTEMYGFTFIRAVRGTPHYGADWIDRSKILYLGFILSDVLIPSSFTSFGWNTVSFWKKPLEVK